MHGMRGICLFTEPPTQQHRRHRLSTSGITMPIFSLSLGLAYQPIWSHEKLHSVLYPFFLEYHAGANGGVLRRIGALFRLAFGCPDTAAVSHLLGPFILEIKWVAEHLSTTLMHWPGFPGG